MVSFCIDHDSGSSCHWWPVLAREEQIIVLKYIMFTTCYMYMQYRTILYSGFFSYNKDTNICVIC